MAVGQLHQDFPNMVYEEELRKIWAATGQPYIELISAYQDALDDGNNPFLPYDLHPSEYGMQIAANALYDSIRQHDLLGLNGPNHRPSD